MYRHIAAAALSVFAAAAFADDTLPYKDGPVTGVSYIRTRDGHFDDYMKYLDTQYKAIMEAQKKAGLITSYAIYNANPRGPGEPDLILAVTYANMAALDKTEETDAVVAKVVGSRETQAKGISDRNEWRTILGGELFRELILK
jgi:hypothetical protein